ncbi:MAG: hypothetical protein GY757_37265 [bacterium]|nr:hypothetical protein [bacterium]
MIKNRLFRVLLFAVLFAALIVPGFAKNKKGVKSAVKNSYDEVTSKLDQGGNFFLYAGTERIIQTVDQLAVKLRGIVADIIAKEKPQKEAMDGLKIYDLLYGMLKKSGLLEISGVGISSITLEPKLNQTKMVLHHYKGNGNGLLWQLMEAKPHDFPSLKLLPRDTVIGGFHDFKLKLFWNWFKKEVEASDLTKFKQSVLSIESMLKAEGIDLNKLLDSFGSTSGLILTLDKTKKTMIPGKMPFEIPEPAIALVFEVKDNYIFSLLQQKLPFAPKESGITSITIPVPTVIPALQPVLVQKDGLFIIATNNSLVDAMFAAKQTGKGLISTAEFKKMSQNIPNQGNRFRYVSDRLSQLILDIQKKFIRTKSKGKDNPGENLLELFSQENGSYDIMQHHQDGLYFVSNTRMNIENMMLIPAVAAAGIVAAIAIPNLLTAMQKGKQKATMGDMRTVSAAIEDYITDNNQAPQGKSLAEIKAKLQPFYIKVLPMKDAWGNDFIYKTGPNKQDFSIASGGKDGVFNGWEQKGSYRVSDIKEFANDIIISNGNFLYHPAYKPLKTTEVEAEEVKK